MASETNPLRDGLAEKLEIDSSDFNSILREQMGDVIRDTPPKPEAEVGKEPDVVERREPERAERTTEREPEVITRSEKAEPPVSQSDEVTRALSTISRLETEITELKRGMYQPREIAPARREPEIEVSEIIPGIVLPKDERYWPIKVTPELVKAVGIDPEIAPGLNKLANLFMIQINQLLRPLILDEVEGRNRSRDTVGAAVNAFYSKYPDLRGQEDILDIVETKARNEDRIAERFAGEDYMAEVARRARTRIAALRGQSLSDYELQVRTQTARTTGAPREATPRAITTPTRRTARVQQTPDQRELEDIAVDARRM